MLAALMLLGTAACAQAQRPTPQYPTGFSERVLTDGLNSPTAVDWAPDGRMFVAEKDGRLKVVETGSKTATQILDISARVNSAGDRGLLGLAVDSDYANNRYVYLLYTYDTAPMPGDSDGTATTSRLQRFTVSPTNVVTPGPVILGSQGNSTCPPPREDLDCMPSDGTSHSIGTVRSAPDGTLWVGSGDAASFGFADRLALRTYDENSLAGKIIRIDRDGKGVAGHPFCAGETDLTKVCTKLWAKGFRNPYRFTLRPEGRGLAVGDVGWSQREELDLVSEGGGNYGWPCREAGQRTPGYRDWTECQAEYAKDGTPSGHKGPAYEYLHDVGSTVIGGPTYTGGRYPSEMDGDIFYGDYSAKTIRRVRVNAQDQVVETKDFASEWSNLVGLERAPNGNVVGVDLGDWAEPNSGAIREIVYQGSEPVASASATPTSGPTPLTVDFTGSSSFDADSANLTYDWDFGDGTARSSAANPRHVYTRAGTFTARLTVTDTDGNSDSTTVTIRPGNDAPTAFIDSPANNSSYRNGVELTVTGRGTDGGSAVPVSGLEWRVLLHHADHVHQLLATSGKSQISFKPLTDHDADSYYEVVLTARDSGGLTGSRSITLRPQTAQARITSTPSGAPVAFGGRDFVAPFSTEAAVGFQTSLSAEPTFARNGRNFYFDRWSDGGERARTNFTVPESGFDLRAIYLEDKSEGQHATASSTYQNNQYMTPDAAVDRDPTSRWSSEFADNQHWQVDLGSARSVDRVRIDWEGAYASRYEILTSLDGTTWTQAAQETITAAGPRTTQFANRKARFVRIRGLQRATQYGISFWDVRVLGPDDDTPAPDTTIASGPEGNVRSREASFDFTSVTGATFECRMDGSSWSACSSPRDYASLIDGQHTFEVRATAPNGITDPSPATRTFTVDTAAPDTQIVLGPSGTTENRNPTFSFTSEIGATFECKLDTGQWVLCTSPQAYTGLGDGPHTFQVRAKDAAGNVDATPASRTFTVDTAPPDTTLTEAPSRLHPSTSAQFKFTGEAGGSFQCKLDGGEWETCSSPKVYNGLGQGAHSFQVRARDAVGNTDASPAAATFTVDTVAPDTTITGSTTTGKNAQFNFSSEAGATYECRMDGGTWQPGCASPRAYSNLAEGAHTFEVRATDPAGNQDASPASRSFTVDTVAPDTSISLGPNPGATITTQSTSFSFASPELGATFECSMDGATFAACDSPKAYAALTEGSHTFAVRAKDAAGNFDTSPATRTFTVDTGRPETTITEAPAATIKDTTAQYRFSSEAGATFRCKLDSGPWENCTSPRALTNLTEGRHTFSVEATDSSGNEDLSPATHEFTVDRTGPDTNISAGPASTIGTASTSFEFASPESGATFECKLDSGAWTQCSSPRAVSGLADGSHTFWVRAKDALGNVDATPANRTFTVNTTSPEPPAGNPSPSPSPSPPPTPSPVTPSETVDTPAPAKPKKPTYAATVMDTRGLKAMFGLGDAGSSRAADAKRGRAGRLRGRPKQAPALARSGRDSRARAFDGKDDRLELDPRSLGTVRALSLEMWVKAARGKAGTLLAMADDPATDGLALTIDRRNRLILTVSDGEVLTTVAGPTLGTARRHLAVTYDRSRLRIYVDGRVTNSFGHRTGIAWKRNRTATVGALAGGKRPFTGTLDELALYDRALSGATVRSHHEAGR